MVGSLLHVVADDRIEQLDVHAVIDKKMVDAGIGVLRIGGNLVAKVGGAAANERLRFILGVPDIRLTHVAQILF